MSYSKYENYYSFYVNKIIVMRHPTSLLTLVAIKNPPFSLSAVYLILAYLLNNIVNIGHLVFYEFKGVNAKKVLTDGVAIQ